MLAKRPKIEETSLDEDIKDIKDTKDIKDVERGIEKDVEIENQVAQLSREYAKEHTRSFELQKQIYRLQEEKESCSKKVAFLEKTIITKKMERLQKDDRELRKCLEMSEADWRDLENVKRRYKPSEDRVNVEYIGPIDHSIASILSAWPCYSERMHGKWKYNNVSDKKQKRVFYFGHEMGDLQFQLFESVSMMEVSVLHRFFEPRIVVLVNGRLYLDGDIHTLVVDYDRVFSAWKESLQIHLIPDVVSVVVNYLANNWPGESVGPDENDRNNNRNDRNNRNNNSIGNVYNHFC